MDGLLGDGALHAVVVAGHNGDVGGVLGVEVDLTALFSPNGAHRAGDGGEDHAVLQGVGGVLGLLALVGEIVFPLADLQLLGLDLHLDVVLLALLSPGQLLLQVFHFLLAGLVAVLEALDVQPKLLEADLQAGHVVAEEGIAFFDLVSGGHVALLHGQVRVRVHLDHVLRLHHPGVPAALSRRAHTCDGGHGLNVDRALLGRLREVAVIAVPAAVAEAAQDQQGQQDFSKGLHSSFSQSSSLLKTPSNDHTASRSASQRRTPMHRRRRNEGERSAGRISLNRAKTQSIPLPAPRRCAT